MTILSFLICREFLKTSIMITGQTAVFSGPEHQEFERTTKIRLDDLHDHHAEPAPVDTSVNVQWTDGLRSITTERHQMWKCRDQKWQLNFNVFDWDPSLRITGLAGDCYLLPWKHLSVAVKLYSFNCSVLLLAFTVFSQLFLNDSACLWSFEFVNMKELFPWRCAGNLILVR